MLCIAYKSLTTGKTMCVASKQVSDYRSTQAIKSILYYTNPTAIAVMECALAIAEK